MARFYMKGKRLIPGAPWRLYGMAVMGIFLSLWFWGCNSTPGAKRIAELESRQHAEEQWGVRPVAVRLTAADHFVDFRYRVTDAEKAGEILSRKTTPLLVDQASGAVLHVPVTKLGPMRASTVGPKEGRVYVVLFANVNGVIQPGSKVTFTMGDARIENLTVEAGGNSRAASGGNS